MYNYTIDKHNCGDQDINDYKNTISHCGRSFQQCNSFFNNTRQDRPSLVLAMVNIIPVLETIKNECQCYNTLQVKLKELYYECNNDCTVCDNSLSSLTPDDTDCLKLMLYYLSFCIFCMCVSPKI